MYLISIIIPVYNVAPYLRRCLDSLLNQTYTNTELIIVDDGSTDESPQICDEYEKKDSRIKVIHKPNGGLSDARNAGLGIARGDMIAFVDSDDWVSRKYLQIMMKCMTEHDADIVECDFVRTDGKKKYSEDFSRCRISSYDTQTAMKELILDRKLHQVVWNKLYRRQVISDILFEFGKYNEDEFWTYQIFARCGKLVKVDAQLYYYFQNSSSIMGQGFKLKRLDAVEARMNRQFFVDQMFPQFSDIAATSLMDTIIYSGQMSMLYLDERECAIAFSKLSACIDKVFRKKRYIFRGRKIHIICNKLALINFRAVCRIRNILKINI